MLISTSYRGVGDQRTRMQDRDRRTPAGGTLQPRSNRDLGDPGLFALGGESMRIRARHALVAVLAAALLAPAAAEGAWVIKGRGFGHGVGLSQYGAYGYAQHGRNYKQILGHYYRKTKVAKGRSGRVRVLLGTQGSVGFANAESACGRDLNPSKDYSFALSGSSVSLLGPDDSKLRACGKEGRAKGGRTISITGSGRYRGDLVARANGDSLMVINSVGAEGYVKGVVANEMPSSWHQQALRAQAVVARSYGLATKRSGAFDHYDDTRSQVYRGRDSETKATNKAVKRTKRKVVKHNGKIATTYYFSTSGGETENSEFGFGGGSSLPYLKSVNDPYDDISPVHKWRVTYSNSQMESRLKALFQGTLKRIQILETGRSPRIVRAKVVGSSGSTTVTGDTLRNRLDLRSTWAKFTKN
jgi:stage II sporulation protein D